MSVNLYFWRAELLTWETSSKYKIQMIKEQDDYCIILGRRELWLIPRNSNSFFQ